MSIDLVNFQEMTWEAVKAFWGNRDVLCQRLVKEQLYSTATILLSPREAEFSGDYRHCYRSREGDLIFYKFLLAWVFNIG